MILWVGTALLLAGVILVVQGKPEYMVTAMVLNLLGDIFLLVFFLINFSLPMVVLNSIYALTAVYGINKWRNVR